VGNGQKHDQNLNQELSTDQWKKIMDDITEAGCLFLLFTGGEPFLRKDFCALYAHAKKNGLLVSIFSNGTLINKKILDLFADLPPKTVEITLYGATQQTYEKITGVRGSFENCMKGINSLKKQKINLRLKTVLMKQNQAEFLAIENLAKELDLKFRFDGALFPTLDGQKHPIEFRVDAEEVVEKEFSDSARFEEWREFFLTYGDTPEGSHLYRCGAGTSYFHISTWGDLQPCLMVPGLQYNLVQGHFSEGWNTVMPQLKTRKIKSDHVCSGCEKKNLCGFCPGFFELETGSEELLSEYLCKMGQIRYIRLNQVLKHNTNTLEGESLEIKAS
jgi:radical SAM protein with 4Fe4S-binding SPASM domain